MLFTYMPQFLTIRTRKLLQISSNISSLSVHSTLQFIINAQKNHTDCKKRLNSLLAVNTATVSLKTSLQRHCNDFL